MKGIARTHGVPKKQGAATTLNDIDKIVAYIDSQGDSQEAARDRAMILLGLYGAFRRSELVSLRWDQVSFENKGIIVTLGRSKTDQEGEG